MARSLILDRAQPFWAPIISNWVGLTIESKIKDSLRLEENIQREVEIVRKKMSIEAGGRIYRCDSRACG